MKSGDLIKEAAYRTSTTILLL